MFYSPDLYRYIFGYISKETSLPMAISELYKAICVESGNGDLKIRVNSRYYCISELLSGGVVKALRDSKP